MASMISNWSWNLQCLLDGEKIEENDKQKEEKKKERKEQEEQETQPMQEGDCECI